jgi:hypothetical protein
MIYFGSGYDYRIAAAALRQQLLLPGLLGNLGC